MASWASLKSHYNLPPHLPVRLALSYNYHISSISGHIILFGHFNISRVKMYLIFIGVSYSFFFSFFFLGLHLQYMEVPRLGGKSELQLQHRIWATSAFYIIACGNAGSLTHWARSGHRTCIFMDTSRVHNPLSHHGNSWCVILLLKVFSSLSGSWNNDASHNPGYYTDEIQHCSSRDNITGLHNKTHYEVKENVR